VDDVRAAATARGLEITVEIEQAGLVTLDQRMCEKILLNLIGNALKFTPTGGKIVTSLRVQADTLELAVRDTGIGIAEHDLGKLFQRFQQVDASSTRRYEGTGLGLSLVKQFAELMGGTVSVESELGRGSRFMVRLPRKTALSVQTAPSEAHRWADLATLSARFGHVAPEQSQLSEVGAGAGKGPLLVLAEDNLDLRVYLTGLLEKHYRVLACSNGAEALDAATRHEPDVIITDVMMPEMDGYELLSRVKANPALSDVPVILVTALANHDALATSLALGAADFLNKPFSPSELLARVAVAARLSAAHKRLSARNAAMRVVLDNVDQGLFTIDNAGRVSEERSAIVDRWFGSYAEPPLFSEYMAADQNFAEAFERAFETLRQGSVSRELCLEQLPKRINVGASQFEVKYLPIADGEALDGLLTVINDVTEQVRMAIKGAEQRELLAVYNALMQDRSGFSSFFAEGSESIRGLVSGTANRELAKRLLHTLKGNAALMGLNVTAGLCHEAEGELAGQGSVGADGLRKLTAMWSSIGRTLEAVLGHENVDAIEVSREEIKALAVEIQQGVRSSVLLARVNDWFLQPTEMPLARLAEYAERLAEGLQKGEIVVDVETHGLRLDPERWTPIWSNLVHVVRNAVDHGIEAPEERVKTGKPPRARLRLTTHVRGEDVLVEVQDDGRGIDWKAIRRTANEKGLPSATHAELLEVMLLPDVSTRQQVNLTSGRGIGLAALADSVRGLGGTISVKSQEGAGTCWQLTVPQDPGPRGGI
jgi:signal transduction histidine kinase